MKAQMKAIAASAIVIVLALAAVSGVTYSWFSDTESSSINVTTGNIILKADVTDAYYKVYGDDEVAIANGGNTPLNGTVGWTVADPGSELTEMIVEVGGMAPGDSLRLVYGGTIETTIDTVFNLTSGVSDPFSIDDIVTINGTEYTSGIIDATNDEVGFKAEITISMSTEAGNELMGKEFNLPITFGFYQANIDSSELPAITTTVTAGEEATVDVVAAGGKAASITMTLDTGGEVNTSIISGSSSEYFLENAGEALVGIDVTLPTGASVTDASVTLSVPTGYDDTSVLTVFHVADNGTMTEVAATITSSDGKTVATFTPSHFSAYYLVDATVAKIEDKGYKTLQEAFDAITNSGEIDLVKDTLGDGVKVARDGNKEVKLDLNGFTYTLRNPVGSTGTETNGFQLNTGNKITIENGTLAVSEENEKKFAVLVQNYGDLIIRDVVIDGTNLDRTIEPNESAAGSSGYSCALSIWCGTVSVEGVTEIYANDEGDSAYAIVVGNYSTYTSPKVTINITGNVDGAVSVVGENNVKSRSTLCVEAGTFKNTTETTDLIVVSTQYSDVDLKGGSFYVDFEHDCAVWAYDGGVVDISGGQYVCEGSSTVSSADHQDLIYAGNNAGKIYISGGEFSSENLAWLLNERDGTGEIVVTGGAFVGWNPGNNVSEGANTSFLSDGYTVVAEGNEYTVVGSTS
ncbi:MAG: hypothetical protein IJ026_06105 [Candidatus Methanomethylophilaceae archaeon]|nr:hypothetical protein [Candidatus Methanomethylophilaceae archaeon]